jgi:hypothetical protein
MGRDDQLRELLGRVFDAAQEGLRDELPPEEYERRRHDFVFHMTDPADDLARFADLVRHPGSANDEETTTFLIGFLYHVLPHLSAAGRLLLDHVPDPFADQREAAPRAERR